MRNAQLFRIGNTELDHTDHGRYRTSLPEHIDAETAQIGNRERKVIVDRILEIDSVPARRLIDLVDQGHDVRGLHDTAFIAVLRSVNLVRHREACDDKNIGGVLERGFSEYFQECHDHSPFQIF